MITRGERPAHCPQAREALEKIQSMVARGTLKEVKKIDVRVGRVVNEYKIAKHFKTHTKPTKCFSITERDQLVDRPRRPFFHDYIGVMEKVRLHLKRTSAELFPIVVVESTTTVWTLW